MGNRASGGTTLQKSPRIRTAWIQRLAITGLCLDGVTTWYVFSAEQYQELNPLLTVLWRVDPSLVGAYFGGFVLVYITVCSWWSGWLSTTVSAYVLVVMGIFGGLNNLELFVFGPPGLLESVADTVGLSAEDCLHSFVPACGLIAGLGLARIRHGSLPWREVAAVVAATVAGSELAYRAIVHGGRLLGG